MQQMHALFKKYTGGQTAGDMIGDTNFQEPPCMEQEEEEEDEFFFDSDQRRESAQSESEQSKWRNGVLVLISNRLGLRQMQAEYFAPVKAFYACKLNCGIIGGRPKEAYYLVGVQEDSLILLDPHTTQQTADVRDLRTSHTEYHEPQAKKFQFNRLDPTMTFAFYLRDADEFISFKMWHDQMKEMYGEFWLFSSMSTKPSFMKQAAYQAQIVKPTPATPSQRTSI